MSSYGTITDPSAIVTSVIQSADPADLQSRVNAVIAALNPATSLIASITLAGAGDGHTFVVTIQSALAASMQGGLPVGQNGGVLATQVRCFLAGTGEDLATAEAAAGVPAALLGGTLKYSAVDTQVAGAAKGTRFMGMTVFELNSVPSPLGLPLAVAERTLTPQVIGGAGSPLVTFDGLVQLGTNFSLQGAGTAVRYDGGRAVEALLDLSISVSLDAPGDITVDLVSDPTGTPTVLASMIASSAAGKVVLSIPWFYEFLPSAFATAANEIGVRVTVPGSGAIQLCHLRMAAR